MEPNRRPARRILACFAALLIGHGALVPAGAQRDTTSKPAPRDTASPAAPAAPFATVAQAEAAGIKLLGVIDEGTGAWIDRATVRDTLGNETITSSIGVAALNALTPVVGYYMLEVRKAGYAPQRVKLKADTAAEFLVSLTPNPLGQATTLPTVVTTAAQSLLRDPGLREGFFARCQMGSTACLGRKDLDRRPTEQLDNLVANSSGITRTCTTVRRPSISGARLPELTSCLIKMRTFPNLPIPNDYCTPTFFWNGREWLQSEQELEQFIVPANVDGIEIYLSHQPRPLRWSVPGSLCGAIVIWTH